MNGQADIPMHYVTSPKKGTNKKANVAMYNVTSQEMRDMGTDRLAWQCIV